MNSDIDIKGNKIITIPPLYAEENIEKFTHLHKKTVKEYYNEEKFNNLEIIEFDGLLYGVLFIYEDVFKPNVIFKFSEPLRDKIINDGGEKSVCFKKNFIRCKFFCWSDSNGIQHIRLALPGDVKVISMINIDDL